MVHFSPSPSPPPPTTMSGNGGAAADRLLLLASITEKDQQQHVTTAVEEGSSEEHTSHVVAKTNIADDIAAVEDEQGSTKARPTDAAVASISSSTKRKSHDEPNADDNNSAQQDVDPTTFTLNEDEDLMVQLHRSGLDRVKIPPLRRAWEIEEMMQNGKLSSYSSSLHSSSSAPVVVNKKKRKISDEAAASASSSSFTTTFDPTSRMLNPSNYATLFPTYPTGHYLNNNNDNGRVYGVGMASTNRGYGGAATGKSSSPFFLPNIVTGGSSPRSAQLLRLNREEEEVVKANMMKQLSGILPAPPFISGGVGGVVRSVSHGNTAPGAAAASSLGHDYHKEIMSMSMAGLSSANRMYYNMMNQPSPRLGPLLAQQQSTGDDEKKKNVLPTPSAATTAAAAASVESEDDPQKEQTKKEKKKLMIKHQLLLPAGQQQTGAASPSPSPSPPQDQEDECSRTTITTKTTVTKKDDTDGVSSSSKHPPPAPSVAIFPNQEIFSQILREKQLKSRPSVPPLPPPLPAAAAAACATESQSESAANDWDGQMTCLPVERDRVPVPSSSSSLPKSKSLMKKSSDEADGALPTSSLSKSKSAKKAVNEETSSSSRNVGAAYEAEARRRLQIELMLRQQQERKLLESLPEYSTAARMLMWQQYNDEQTMMMNPSSSLPLPLPSQLKPHHQSSDQVKLSLLELENQVRSEEHYARICSQNTRRMMELHHQASQLEQQMKLRELEFMRERRRLEDIQAVNRLRLQADALEQRLLMYGGNGETLMSSVVKSDRDC
jgi:hypothetical protein